MDFVIQIKSVYLPGFHLQYMVNHIESIGRTNQSGSRLQFPNQMRNHVAELLVVKLLVDKIQSLEIGLGRFSSCIKDVWVNSTVEEFYLTSNGY